MKKRIVAIYFEAGVGETINKAGVLKWLPAFKLEVSENSAKSKEKRKRSRGNQ